MINLSAGRLEKRQIQNSIKLVQILPFSSTIACLNSEADWNTLCTRCTLKVILKKPSPSGPKTIKKKWVLWIRKSVELPQLLFFSFTPRQAVTRYHGNGDTWVDISSCWHLKLWGWWTLFSDQWICGSQRVGQISSYPTHPHLLSFHSLVLDIVLVKGIAWKSMEINTLASCTSVNLTLNSIPPT